MSEAWTKCWGINTELFRNNSCSLNYLVLRKGGVCSWHYHQQKHNKFFVLSGKVLVKTEHDETTLEPGNSLIVRPPLKHLFEALEDSKMIEIMYVEYVPEDIIRIVQGFLKKSEKELLANKNAETRSTESN